MTAAGATATAAVFTWLGMVVAISFLEAPLKFRAPGVTVRIGLGIGRLVFRGLNTAEAILATVLLVSAAAAAQLPPARVIAAWAAAIAVLLVQLAVVRPRLSRRLTRSGRSGWPSSRLSRMPSYGRTSSMMDNRPRRSGRRSL